MIALSGCRYCKQNKDGSPVACRDDYVYTENGMIVTCCLACHSVLMVEQCTGYVIARVSVEEVAGEDDEIYGFSLGEKAGAGGDANARKAETEEWFEYLEEST